MTREVKKAVTRIRRVQDAVYNNKLGICHSMSIHTNTLVRCDGEVMTWWTVFAHQGEPQVGEKIAHRSEPAPDAPIDGERPALFPQSIQ